MAQKTYDLMLKTMYKYSVPLIKPSEIDTVSKYIFLDAREAEEYETSHIENAVFVGYENFSKKSVKNIDKDSKLIVYCSVGYRSERIGEKLQSMGFNTVYNMYGGIFQWKNDGHNVVNEKGVVTDTVHTYNRLWSIWLKNGVKKHE